MPSNYICTLDIGNTKISACVAGIKRKHITEIFFESIPSYGLSKGLIVNSVNLVSSISQILKSLKNKSGINIKYLYINISGQAVINKHTRAIMPLAERGDKVVTASDMQRVNDQALTLGSNLEEEIIHEIPYSYNIDTKNNILNPVGLYSHKLEVDLYLICVKLSCLQSLTHAVNQAGYEVKDVFFSGFATSEAVFNKGQKKGLNVLCDIGSDTTEILVFKDGMLRNVNILLNGGNDMTSKIQEALNIPFEFAEDIKKSYGVVGDSDLINEGKEILIKKDGNYKPIKQRLVSEVITGETKAYCQLLKEEIKKNVALSEIDNLTVCGMSILQEGFLEMLESALGINVQLGRIMNESLIQGINNNEVLSGQKYLAYTTCLGILCLALEEYTPPILAVQKPIRNPIIKLVNRVKDIYQEYF